VMMFDEKAKGKGEFYLRQILGSVNYPTGSNLNDFFLRLVELSSRASFVAKYAVKSISKSAAPSDGVVQKT